MTDTEAGILQREKPTEWTAYIYRYNNMAPAQQTLTDEITNIRGFIK